MRTDSNSLQSRLQSSFDHSQSSAAAFGHANNNTGSSTVHHSLSTFQQTTADSNSDAASYMGADSESVGGPGAATAGGKHTDAAGHPSGADLMKKVIHLLLV